MLPVSEEMERAVLRGCPAVCYCSNDCLGFSFRCDFITAKLHHKCSLRSHVLSCAAQEPGWDPVHPPCITQSMTRFLAGSAAGSCLGCFSLRHESFPAHSILN